MSPQTQVDPQKLAISRISTIHHHAKSCGKPLGDCKACKLNMFKASEIPINLLSQALEDKVATPFRTSFASVAVDRLIDRTNHRSVRATRDVAISMGYLKGYEQRGGGL